MVDLVTAYSENRRSLLKMLVALSLAFIASVIATTPTAIAVPTALQNLAMSNLTFRTCVGPFSRRRNPFVREPLQGANDTQLVCPTCPSVVAPAPPPSACQCQPRWTYYPPGPLGPPTSVMNGCSTTPPTGAITNASTPWCYVQGNSCATALAPSAAAVTARNETRKWKLCIPPPCKCMDQFSYANTTYFGCNQATATTPNSGGQPWCYVYDTSTGGTQGCATGKASAHANETRRWRTCEVDPQKQPDPCGCQAKWTLGANTLEGCAATTQFGTTPPNANPNTKWCFVNDPTRCRTAQPSWLATEERKWRLCDGISSKPMPCQCQRSWKFPPAAASPAGDTFYGCALQPTLPDPRDNDPVPWCYVQSNNCSSAVNSSARFPWKWKTCTPPPCKCMNQVPDSRHLTPCKRRLTPCEPLLLANAWISSTTRLGTPPSTAATPPRRTPLGRLSRGVTSMEGATARRHPLRQVRDYIRRHWPAFSLDLPAFSLHLASICLD